MRWMIAAALLASISCWGQSEYRIPLEKLNSTLAVPTVTGREGVIYVAHRSFDWLRFSSQLEVLVYDTGSRKELRHVTIPVPKVHGARAADGLFLSKDGQVLAYAELHDPHLLLLLSTKDLSEIRRSTTLPFTSEDRKRVFAGFDNDNLLIFASINANGLRLIRVNTATMKGSSDTKFSIPDHDVFEQMAWSKDATKIWVTSTSTRGDEWQEYNEDGVSTGQNFRYQLGISNGAIVLGEGKVLAFYGNMVAKGAVISYSDHRTAELKLECLPRPYGTSNDPEYAGAICTTSPDREPESVGGKILSSKFLLLNTEGPSIVWRQNMDSVGVANGNGPNEGFQRGDPLIFRSGKKVWIVAPSKSPELKVYEVVLPQ